MRRVAKEAAAITAVATQPPIRSDRPKAAQEVARKRKHAERYLKRFSAMLKNKDDGSRSREWPADAAPIALQLSGQLQRWPQLSAQNLHEFRKLVKQLR